MVQSSHRKIRQYGKRLVTRRDGTGKKNFVAPVIPERGLILMASETHGVKCSDIEFLNYLGGYNDGSWMVFTIDTTKNPNNASDATFIVPLQTGVTSSSFTIDWGDGTTTDIQSGTTVTLQQLTHTYSTAGIHSIKIESLDDYEIPVFNWSLYDTNGNKNKLIGHNTPLINFNSTDLSQFAKDCVNLQYICPKFFQNFPYLTRVDYAFDGCVSLTYIPKNLFAGCQTIRSFQHCFSHCPYLTTIPNDVFKGGVVSNTDLSNFYDGDVRLTAYIDANDYAGGTYRSHFVDIHEMFKNCTNTTGDAQDFIAKFTQYTAYIDGNGTIDTGWGVFTGRIYPQVIYDSDGNKVRDLIPANTGYYYNGKIAPQPCLYDSITDSFFLPTPDNSFTYHEEIDTSAQEDNIPDSYKRRAFYNCDKWDNYARVENIWTGILDGREWLATSSLKDDWLIIDDKTLLITRFDTNDLLATTDESILATTVDTLSALTGDHSSTTPTGVIRPEKYETLESLRNIINYLPDDRGYVPVGDISIVNGIASGFTNTNYATTGTFIDPTLNLNNNFEAQIRMSTSSLSSGTGLAMHYFTGVGGISSGPRFFSNGKISWLIGRDDTSNENKTITGTTQFSTNTLVYAKLGIKNNLATLSSSIDGTTWTQEGTLDTTDMVFKLYYDRPFGFGHAGISTNNNYVFETGTIDFQNTYIVLNNKMWFDGTEKLNEVLDLRWCVNKGGLTQADLQIAIDKGYTVLI